MSTGVDLLVLYKIIKKLTTPFKDTDAYKLGIIDENGRVLKSRDTLKTVEEKNAFTLLDVFVNNMKKILAKVPGGSSKLMSFGAALYLLRENKNPSKENFISYLNENVEEINQLYSDNKSLLTEESPTVSAGSGQIASIGVGPDGEPPGRSKVKRTRFAGHDVFLVNPNVFLKARLGKKKYLKYKKYVGEDETGEEIRVYARTYPDRPVILQNEMSGEMMFLRRGKDPNRLV